MAPTPLYLTAPPRDLPGSQSISTPCKNWEARGGSLIKGPCPGQSLGLHLKKQFLGVDVIDQACVIFIHHGQLVSRGTHVQAAYSCGLLQQDDGKEIVHKDLQNLAKFQRKKCESPWQQDCGTLPGCLLESHVFYKNNSYNFTRSSVQRQGLIKRKGPGLILECSSSEVTKVMTCQP